MCPKFTGLEDTYLFLSELKKCGIFVPFALKNNVNRCMYSLLANFILVGMISLNSFCKNIFRMVGC